MDWHTLDEQLGLARGLRPNVFRLSAGDLHDAHRFLTLVAASTASRMDGVFGEDWEKALAERGIHQRVSVSEQRELADDLLREMEDEKPLYAHDLLRLISYVLGDSTTRRSRRASRHQANDPRQLLLFS